MARTVHVQNMVFNYNEMTILNTFNTLKYCSQTLFLPLAFKICFDGLLICLLHSSLSSKRSISSKINNIFQDSIYIFFSKHLGKLFLFIVLCNHVCNKCLLWNQEFVFVIIGLLFSRAGYASWGLSLLSVS